MDWDEMARPWLATAPDLEAAFQEVFAALFSAADLKKRGACAGCGMWNWPNVDRCS